MALCSACIQSWIPSYRAARLRSCSKLVCSVARGALADVIADRERPQARPAACTPDAGRRPQRLTRWKDRAALWDRLTAKRRECPRASLRPRPSPHTHTTHTYVSFLAMPVAVSLRHRVTSVATLAPVRSLAAGRPMCGSVEQVFWIAQVPKSGQLRTSPVRSGFCRGVGEASRR
jgi:hypothetical protein